jgi:hypothetical protein
MDMSLSHVQHKLQHCRSHMGQRGRQALLTQLAQMTCVWGALPFSRPGFCSQSQGPSTIRTLCTLNSLLVLPGGAVLLVSVSCIELHAPQECTAVSSCVCSTVVSRFHTFSKQVLGRADVALLTSCGLGDCQLWGTRCAVAVAL